MAGPKTKSKAPKPANRVIEYNVEIAAEICARIAGGASLASICVDKHMPCRVTIYRWIATNEKFKGMYELAREDQADTLADEIIAIADELPVMLTKDSDGNDATRPILLDAAGVNRQRLRVDSRKWVASKLKAKKYGDRTELVGAEGAPLIPPKEPADAMEAARRVIFVLSRAAALEQLQPAAPLQLTNEAADHPDFVRTDLHGQKTDRHGRPILPPEWRDVLRGS